MKSLGALAGIMLLTCVAAAAQTIDWQTYRDAYLAISLPMGLFEAAENGEAGSGGFTKSLYSPETDAILRVASGAIPAGTDLSEVAKGLDTAEAVKEVTYSAGGKQWFVLSGYIRTDEENELIFYAKFLASRDLSRFAFFEITYPKDQKRYFDPVVTRIEKSLRAF